MIATVNNNCSSKTIAIVRLSNDDSFYVNKVS